MKRVDGRASRLQTGFNDALLVEHDRIAIGVSGGGDSLALLHLVSNWASSRDVTVFAFTVDHGLRDEARAEAGFVSAICTDLHIAHETLRATGLPSDTGIQKNAREARYDLLLEAAQIKGCSLLLVAHTQEDQAETIAMRLARSTGDGFGLAGMSERVLLENAFGSLVLARPLLGALRSDLRAHLNGLNQSWVDDPSNDDRRFERVRLRQKLGEHPSVASSLLTYGNVLRRLKKQVADEAARLVAHSVKINGSAIAEVSRAGLSSAPMLVQVHAMQALLSVLGGTLFLPPHQKVCEFLKAPHTMTLSRCVLAVGAEHISVSRECRDLPAQMALPSHPIVWDRRFLLRRRTENPCAVRVLPAQKARDYWDANDCARRGVADAYPVFLAGDGANKRLFTENELAEICAITPLMGALQTFCSEENWSLRCVLKQMFTNSVHAE